MQEDGTYKCNQCEIVLKAGKHLSSHKHWKCDICDFSCLQQGGLQKHQVEKHGMDIAYKYMCDKCDYKSFMLKHLQSHVQTVHENKKEMCTICGKDFKFLSHHMRIDHSELANKVVCEICGRTVKASALAKHIRYLHEANLCTICTKFLPSKSQLMNHYSKEHQVFCLNKEQFVCDQCNQKFQSSQDLHDHLTKDHEMLSDQKCTKCEYSFPNKVLLAIHLMNIHDFKQSDAAMIFGTLKIVEDDTTKNFVCEFCNKRFTSKRSLNGHFKQYHGDKSLHYKCDQCDFSSFEKNKLKRHKKTQHEKPTEFKCEFCPYVTNLRGIMNKHIKHKHQKVKEYPCTECGKEFVAKTNLASHMLLEHNIVFKYSRSKI